jgi:phospholipase/lecithinase/hemolysin
MKIITHLLSTGFQISVRKAKKTVSISIATLFIGVSTASFAEPISNLVVFGDSLSDAGAFNTIAPQFCRPDPYFDCRFSDGRVWAELLAEDLGVSANSAYAGGTNYAIGGQRSDDVLGYQIPTFLAANGGVADADALYVIWAGGNDYLQNNPDGTFSPITAADNILASITALSEGGATDFLIPNLPIAETWAFTFNNALAEGLNAIDFSLNITQFDAFSAFLDMTLNPSDYGFTNVTDACFDGVNACANPAEFLLWDTVHPTAAAHEYIAAAALDALQVSAPTTILFLSLGVVTLIRTKRTNLA